MFELNGAAFYEAVTEVRRIRTILQSNVQNMDQRVDDVIRERFGNSLNGLQEALQVIGARLAMLTAHQLGQRLAELSDGLTYAEMSTSIDLIEGRVRDELTFVQMFVIPQNQAQLFGGADFLLGQPTADRFPSAWFDCEEAAKCLVLGRPTACVFHCMKMLEIAIKALSARLEIPDPIKPVEKNWGKMLGKIKEALDAKFPSSARMPNSEGSWLERIYASLDAVKNPWRNATMHVENVYTEAEANHILQCVAVLLQNMAQQFDENGADVGTPDLIG